MSSSFRFKASRPDLNVKEIAALRRISPYSISEIRRRAASQETLLDIPVFAGEWPLSKAKVVALLESIETEKLPLSIYSVQSNTSSQQTEEGLTVLQARQRLRFLREIALEQDMHAQLEEGHISNPEEYIRLPESDA